MTGLGIVSPIGNNVKSAWQAAVSGQSGIRRIISFQLASRSKSEMELKLEVQQCAHFLLIC